MRFETLEERRLLSLSHLYTFNDGLANDWIGAAHATLFNGATVSGGQLVLNNSGVTSGQSGVVQHARLGANVLPSGDATVEVWFTAANSSAFTRVFDIGSSLAGVGNSYLSFNLEDLNGNSQGLFLAAGASEIGVSGPALDDGTQHMAAIVVDTAADLMRLYFDGNEVGTNSLGGASAGDITDTLAYLGRSLFDVDSGFTGSINELRIYDDARSATDIAADAAAGPSTATKSPLVRQMEYLDRGMVAVRRATAQAYVGWRLLGTDPADIAFNLYRSTSGGAPVKLNASPLTQTTDFVDSTANMSATNTYFVRPIVGGIEQEPSDSFTLVANAPVQQFLNVPLQRPAGGTTPAAENYTYNANDASVGDLDGDGDYEIILKWDPSNSKDNSQSGYTGNVYVDAYDFDGQGNSTLLWRIDLGINMRAGAHYSPFLVYDFDGDGKAEIIMRTAEGTIDGIGTVIGNSRADYRNSSGYVLAGPEYLSVFDGFSGAILDSIAFEPERGSVSSWGDSYGNRVDRFQATVAYLDGVRPSIVWNRGYAGPQSGFSARNEVAAYDYVNGELSVRWVFEAATNGANPTYVGQSAHSITVGDLDGDGKDEIITGGAALHENGTLLYNTGLGHGDAMHLSDMIPSRPGLEFFMPHETPSAYQSGGRNAGGEFRDARTGELLFGIPATNDVGRGVAFDIDPNHSGYEFWAATNDPNGGLRMVYSSSGQPLYRMDAETPGGGNAANDDIPVNFGIWWDADLTRELLDGTTISNWRYDLPRKLRETAFAPSGVASNNGTKATPSLSGDILGDWREELIVRASNNLSLRIYTTTIPAADRLYTLMHDPQYRQAISWQNSGYNQPPHPSFFLGAGMAPPPVPQIYTVQAAPEQPGDYNGDNIVDTADYTVWRNAFGGTYDPNADGNGDQMIDEADYTVWKQNYGKSSSVTIVTNPPPAGAGSGQFASVLNEPSVQDAAFTQPSLLALWSSGEGSRFATGTSGLSESAAVNQPAVTARNHDLLFTLLDQQPSEVQSKDVGSIDADGDTAKVQDEFWAELDDVLPRADWLRL